jgi:hypothetical protein
MTRTSAIASTISTLLLGVLATAAAAAAPARAPGEAHFRAHPATASTAQRLVVRDTVFRCGVDGCVAPRGTSRPELVCSALAREVGTVASFIAGGRSFDAAALETCNRRAR